MTTSDVHDAPTLILESCEVHVWRARVSAFAERENDFRATLDDAELWRAARFRFAGDRTQYVVAHGLVRALLGRYVDVAARRLRFAVGTYGKPSLCEPTTQPPLEYNLAHSGDIVLIAVARGRPVGVDVERWAGDIVYDELAEYCFSAAERAELAATAPSDKPSAFFTGWSRKEAYIKATGVGVADGLDYFDVSLAPKAPGLLADRRSAASAGCWRLDDVAVIAGYSGAVVARGADWRLHCAWLGPGTRWLQREIVH